MNMARGRFRKVARRARGFARKAYRAASSPKEGPLTAIGYGFGYGALRKYAASGMSPVTNYLPFGQFNDEAGLAIAGFAAAKWGKGMVRQAGLTALKVEAASVGASITGGMTSSSSSSQFSI